MVSNQGSDKSGKDQRLALQSLPTTAALENCLQILESNSPLNLTPVTNFARQEFISRISFLENKISKMWLFKSFVQLGIPPLYLFIILIIMSGLMIGNMYKRSVYLLCNLVGVVYPAYKSIQTIDSLSTISDNEKEVSNSSTVIVNEQKQWLTYWAIYGWLQVADHWSNWLLEMFPGYNLFKLIFLYWAQDDRSRGATLIFEKFLKPLLQKNIQNNNKIDSFTTNQKQRQTLRQRQQLQYNGNELYNQQQSSSLVSEPTPEEIWRRDTVVTSRENEIKPYRLNNV
ncbi:TB2/DP1, HVA22 family-domain-containing protein [Glomus cerebriforme]|uniref:Protein YOP1 n=1 Tax=Glomus cerebriforme TaxID=658196 RepID=A0A397TJ17_9GLOM|nr:TB2/DP1, HVA22 family-domain-containing protein [Glomus cerebriforme]